MPSVEVPGDEGPLDLYYDVYANGERDWVIFAHGAGGNAGSWWQQVPVFYETYNVIAFDHRAFGRSRCSAGNFDPNRFVGDLTAIIEAQGIQRTALVCQSMGGWTGLGYALANPDRVWALVMSHTVGGLATAAMDAARRRVQAQGHTPSEPFGSWALDLDLPDTNPTLSHLYNCIYAQNRDFLEIGGINAFGRKRPEVDTTQVAGFAVPTLFVTGDKDVVIPADAVEAAHAELPHSELVNLGPVGHSSYFETAAAFNETVGGFLARHSPAS